MKKLTLIILIALLISTLTACKNKNEEVSVVIPTPSIEIVTETVEPEVVEEAPVIEEAPEVIVAEDVTDNDISDNEVVEEPEVELVRVELYDEPITRYATTTINIRNLPSMEDSEIVGKYKLNEEVTVIGDVYYKGELADFYATDNGNFIKKGYISETKTEVTVTENPTPSPAPVAGKWDTTEYTMDFRANGNITEMATDGVTTMYQMASNYIGMDLNTFLKKAKCTQYGDAFDYWLGDQEVTTNDALGGISISYNGGFISMFKK